MTLGLCFVQTLGIQAVQYRFGASELSFVWATKSMLLCALITALQTAITTAWQLNPNSQGLFLLAGLSYLTESDGAFELAYLFHLTAVLLTGLVAEIVASKQLATSLA